jgi:hypothetical protein
MCERVADFCAAKEQSEYLHWLEEAAKFAKK